MLWLLLSATRSQLTICFASREVHPGGSRLILQYAGRDATVAFDEVHGNQTLEENLPKDRLVGILTPSGSFNATIPKSKEELRIEKERKVMPPLDRMRALSDFEVRASCISPSGTLLIAVSQGCSSPGDARKDVRILGIRCR